MESAATELNQQCHIEFHKNLPARVKARGSHFEHAVAYPESSQVGGKPNSLSLFPFPPFPSHLHLSAKKGVLWGHGYC